VVAAAHVEELMEQTEAALRQHVRAGYLKKEEIDTTHSVARCIPTSLFFSSRFPPDAAPAGGTFHTAS
jgi:hypothetical protein